MESNITSYQDAMNWLFTQLPMFSRTGGAAYKAGLERVEALDEAFSYPHRKFKSIHIAGTNGKGSTSHLIASALMEKGLKTALYTSPHLVDFRERIKINGEMIPHSEVVDFTKRIKAFKNELQPSFFEITMMMAFNWFASQNVDVAVIETGMGGRLDSTNIITPCLSVITNISPDHTQFLGNTLPEIAAEKSGIIKRGIPVVIGERQEDVAQVFINKSSAQCAPIEFASDKDSELQLSLSFNGWEITFPSGLNVVMPMGGEYQRHNIITAWRSLRNLPLSLRPSEEEIARGFERIIANTNLMGRWMKLSEHPYTIADTGHNIAGLKYNIAQMNDYLRLHPHAKLHIVLGFVNDKDIDHILPLFPTDATFYFTQASIPRALKVEELIEKAEAEGLFGKTYKLVKDAYKEALLQAEYNDMIYIGGSTFVVADLLA